MNKKTVEAMNLVLLLLVAASFDCTAAFSVIKPSKELVSIGRLRYDIYNADLLDPNRHVYVERDINHENAIIIDSMDRTALNLVSHDEKGQLTGCIRINLAKDGIDPNLIDFCEIQPYQIERVAFISRFGVRPEHRGSTLAMRLAKSAFQTLTCDHPGIDCAYFLASKNLAASLYMRMCATPLFEKEHHVYGHIVCLRFDLKDVVGASWAQSASSRSPFSQRRVEASAAVHQAAFHLPTGRPVSLALHAMNPTSTAEIKPDSGTPRSQSNDYMHRIEAAFSQSLDVFTNCKAIELLMAADFTLDQYKSILRELYYYVREDPQIQALATAYLRGNARESVRALLKHAASETGHEQLALADLQSLGEDITQIPFLRPLPSTMGLISFAFYQVMFLNPIGHLGFLYFLEFLPTAMGGVLKGMLLMGGIPECATSFLDEHTIADVGHNKLMQEHVRKLVVTEEDCNAVVLAIHTTALQYATLFDGAIMETSIEAHLSTTLEGIAPSSDGLVQP